MKQRKKGIVLIITLWIIVVLTVVSLAMVRQINLEVKMVGFQRDVTIVDSLALAGLRQAIIVLREDKLKDSGEQMQETLFRFGEDDAFMYDGGTELWADYPELFEEVPFYEMGEKRGYYYVEIEDESSKLPINAAAPEMLAHLIELTGVDEEDAFFLASAIQDFKDGDQIPHTASSGGSGMGGGRQRGGAGRDASDETSFYNGRSNRDELMPEILMKNGSIGTLDELLLIPGMTPAILYGTVDPDEQQSRRRSRRGRRGEYLGLVNYMTVYSNKVNLNTVKPEVMESILFPVVGENAQQIAEDWTEYRDGGDGMTYTQDDRVLKTIDNSDMDNVDISRVQGLTPQLLGQLGVFHIDSDVFVVKAFGEYGDIKKGYRAIVRRHFTPWEQLPEFGVEVFDVKNLEQVEMEVMLFEPLFDAKDQLRS